VKEKIGIINFDAHFDMRPLLPGNQGSSGTPFLQIAQAHAQNKRRFDYNCIGIQPSGNMQALFDTAKQYDVNVITAEQLYKKDEESSLKWLDDILKRNDMAYLSLCLDVFATPYAPGVSAPQILGLTPWQVLPLVKHLAASGKIIAYDVAEFSPQYDIDHRTAKLAAAFIHAFIHHHKAYQAGKSA
jgi:formiminoglutamase